MIELKGYERLLTTLVIVAGVVAILIVIAVWEFIKWLV